MALDITSILNSVVSHALALGYFEHVNMHEPVNAPTNGLSAAVWVDRIEPARGTSGLNSTTGRLVLMVRIYSSMVQEPQDAIDPNMMDAVSALFEAYSGDFELDGNVRNVDLLGETGLPLMAQAGYIEQDSAVYRVFTVTLPLIVNDIWSQSA